VIRDCPVTGVQTLFFFQAEDGIRDFHVTGVQTCALPIWGGAAAYYIDRLAAAGVVHGCDPPHNRRFCPQDTLRRGHIVKMVVRLFDLEAPDSYTSPWTDTAGHYFEEEARVAAFAGIIDASSGVFDGYRSVTRAEFARLVVAVFE